MNNIPSSPTRAVPSIYVQGADDTSALFDDGEMFQIDMCNYYNFVAEETSHYPCSRGLQPEYVASNSFPSSQSELEDITELSYLTTTSQPLLTGFGISVPYSDILRENSVIAPAEAGLSPSSLGSPVPSPASSFAPSLSPSSLYEPMALSDSESPVSPSPATPDQQFIWPHQVLNSQSSDSLALLHSAARPFSNDSIPSLAPSNHRRSRSSPSARREPVASKAMLEANTRRRRHPAQFTCKDCGQTFTALFSLKRHEQSHTGERPFACNIPGCNQRFYNSSDCKRHEKSKKRHKDLVMQ